MADIRTLKGLTIPVRGAPKGVLRPLEADGKRLSPKRVALTFYSFEGLKPRLLKKAEDVVKIGEPLVEDKSTPGRFFVSPGSGVIVEVKRGLKRRLLEIVIELNKEEEHYERAPLPLTKASRDELIERLKEGGLFAHIRQRPFDRLADPHKKPRAIFVKALESAPFVPSSEMQVEGYESYFQVGLDALKMLTDGDIHLVYSAKSSYLPFKNALNVIHHTAEGPHPVANPSLHIHEISPIQKVEEVVWTLTAYDVTCIGMLLETGRYRTARPISVGGPGCLEGREGFFEGRMGMEIEPLITNRLIHEKMRFVSGNLLMGTEVAAKGFLDFYDMGLALLPLPKEREMLHFFRLGIDKYSASHTYLSGFLKGSERTYNFTTSQHGEERFFVTSSPYDKVMPMNIPTMPLAKAVMAEDFDLAEELGLLEVAPEDFALATFVCPSKMELVEIIRKGLLDYAPEVLH